MQNNFTKQFAGNFKTVYLVHTLRRLQSTSSTLHLVHTPLCPHSASSTLRLVHTPPRPHFASSILRFVHTPPRSHFASSTLHLVRTLPCPRSASFTICLVTLYPVCTLPCLHATSSALYPSTLYLVYTDHTHTLPRSHFTSSTVCFAHTLLRPPSLSPNFASRSYTSSFAVCLVKLEGLAELIASATQARARVASLTVHFSHTLPRRQFASLASFCG